MSETALVILMEHDHITAHVAARLQQETKTMVHKIFLTCLPLTLLITLPTVTAICIANDNNHPPHFVTQMTCTNNVRLTSKISADWQSSTNHLSAHDIHSKQSFHYNTQLV
jgi:hypothetical protein